MGLCSPAAGSVGGRRISSALAPCLALRKLSVATVTTRRDRERFSHRRGLAQSDRAGSSCSPKAKCPRGWRRMGMCTGAARIVGLLHGAVAVLTLSSVPAEWRPAVMLAAIDCADEANQQVCANFGITGFPTLKVRRGGCMVGRGPFAPCQCPVFTVLFLVAVPLLLNGAGSTTAPKYSRWGFAGCFAPGPSSCPGWEPLLAAAGRAPSLLLGPCPAAELCKYAGSQRFPL